MIWNCPDLVRFITWLVTWLHDITTLRILLELVLTTLSHLFSSLFSELKSHDDEFNTCPSVVLCLVRLCKSIKQEVRAGTSLICWRYRGVTGLNVVVFTRGETRDIQTNLSTAEGAVNAEITKDLLSFVYDDEKDNKVPSEVTDLSRGEIFSNVFFDVLVYDSLLKLIW